MAANWVAAVWLAWLVGLLGVVWRGERAWRAWLDRRQQLDAQTLALKERELALAERRAASVGEMPPLPLDLQTRVNAETEAWARGELQALVQQLWTKHQAWDPVRAELAELDAQALARELGWSQTRVVS